VIFDMDGVLIDSNPTHAAAWIQYLSDLGLPYEGIDACMAGKRNDQILRILLGDTASDCEIFAHGAAKEALYRRMMEPEKRLMPGLRPFLNTLVSLPLGLALPLDRK